MKKPLKIFLGIIVFALVSIGCFTAASYGGKLIDKAKQTAYLGEDNDPKEDDDEKSGGDDESLEEDGIGNDGKDQEIAQGTALDVFSSQEKDGVTQVVENVMPAIVSINCTAYYQQEDFFGRRYNSQGSGAGSGIIIGQNSKEVLVVTNAHVVGGKEPKVSVVFCDGKEYPAEIKGSDTESDLAIVSVNVSSMDRETINSIKIASLGSSDDTKIGEMAIAIGNALGYGQSVTVGYISAKERKIEIEDSSQSMSLIQTDAAINPGNSGGALINLKGEIIGINSAKFSDTDVEGMGFSIPISDALPIITALMNEEEVEHKKAYLGIIGTDVSQADSEAFHMPVGIYIREVSEDSPAEKAGLMPGQIIVKCNNKEVTMTELESILNSASSGDTLTLTVKQLNMGDYEEKDVAVTLGEKTEKAQEQQEEEERDSREEEYNLPWIN